MICMGKYINFWVQRLKSIKNLPLMCYFQFFFPEYQKSFLKAYTPIQDWVFIDFSIAGFSPDGSGKSDSYGFEEIY